MKTSLETLGPCARRVQVELPAERFDAQLQRQLRRLARTVRIKGFRPGRVPPAVVRQRYLPDAVNDAARALIQESLEALYAEHALRPVADPAVTVREAAEGRPLRYELALDVYPQLSEAQVAALALRDPGAAVAEAEVEAAMERMRREQAAWAAVERPARAGDRVRVRYAPGAGAVLGADSPEEVLDLSEEGCPPSLYAALLGARAQACGEAQLADAAGGMQPLAWRLEEVLEARLPDWDDAALLRVFGADGGGLTRARANVRAHLEQLAASLRRRLLSAQIAQALVAPEAAAPMAVPESLRLHCLRQLLGAEAPEAADLAAVPAAHPAAAQARADAAQIVALEALGALSGAEPSAADERRVVEGFARQYRDPRYLGEELRRNAGLRARLAAEVRWEALLPWVLERAKVESAPAPEQAAEPSRIILAR